MIHQSLDLSPLFSFKEISVFRCAFLTTLSFSRYLRSFSCLSHYNDSIDSLPLAKCSKKVLLQWRTLNFISTSLKLTVFSFCKFFCLVTVLLPVQNTLTNGLFTLAFFCWRCACCCSLEVSPVSLVVLAIRLTLFSL